MWFIYFKLFIFQIKLKLEIWLLKIQFKPVFNTNFEYLLHIIFIKLTYFSNWLWNNVQL